MDNQQALELLHRYHDATNAGALDELDDIFADDFINFGSTAAAWPVAARGEDAPLAAMGVSL